MIGKWIRRITGTLFGIVTALLFCGALYQYIGTRLDERLYPPIGKMVDVGGFKMHIYSMGSKAGPTVVLEAGLGGISTDWGLVQPEIAKFARVVSYDRAGTGWSERSPYPRTSRQIVKELHMLLSKENIPKPYILVGHSFGGSNVQLFAATYPDEVVGLVLVDSCHEEQQKRLPLDPFHRHVSTFQNSKIVHFLSTFGITRFFSEISANAWMSFLPQWMQRTRLAVCASTKHAYTVSQEAKYFTESLKQLEDADHTLLKTKPCYILSAGIETDMSLLVLTKEQVEAAHLVYLAWKELQKDLVLQFEGSHHLVAEKSDHMILWREPELIVSAVRELSSK